jgi:hypothetical protein
LPQFFAQIRKYNPFHKRELIFLTIYANKLVIL